MQIIAYMWFKIGMLKPFLLIINKKYSNFILFIILCLREGRLLKILTKNAK